MVLSVFERIVLLGILPAMDQGNRAMYRVKAELFEVLSFSEEQLALLQIKEAGDTYEENGETITVEPGLAYWQNDVVGEEEVDLSGEKKKLLQKQLKKLDRAEQLLPVHIPIYDKIMEDD